MLHIYSFGITDKIHETDGGADGIMNKRIILLLFFLLLISSILFVGCVGEEEKEIIRVGDIREGHEEYGEYLKQLLEPKESIEIDYVCPHSSTYLLSDPDCHFYICRNCNELVGEKYPHVLSHIGSDPLHASTPEGSRVFVKYCKDCDTYFEVIFTKKDYIQIMEENGLSLWLP